jgi:transposase InsO family protein
VSAARHRACVEHVTAQLGVSQRLACRVLGQHRSVQRSPWENGYVESFNGKLRDELLNAEVFHTLAEARVLIEQWRRHCNTHRPHCSLGYRPPAPEVRLSMPWNPSGSGSNSGGMTIAH